MSSLIKKCYDHVTNIPKYDFTKTILNRIINRTFGNTLDQNSKEEIIVLNEL